MPVVDGIRMPNLNETPELARERELKEAMYLENVKRAEAQRMMATLIGEHNRPEPRSKFFAEAKFYLEDANYDFEKATHPPAGNILKKCTI